MTAMSGDPSPVNQVASKTSISRDDTSGNQPPEGRLGQHPAQQVNLQGPGARRHTSPTGSPETSVCAHRLASAEENGAPVDAGESVGLALRWLSYVGQVPELWQEMLKVLNGLCTGLHNKLSGPDELADTVRTELQYLNAETLLGVKKGIEVANQKRVSAALGRMCRDTLQAVVQEIGACVKKAFSEVAAQQKKVVLYAKQMCAATERNDAAALRNHSNAALWESSAALSSCRLPDSEREGYGMLKDAIARLMQDDALLPDYLRRVQLSTYSITSSPVRQGWIVRLRDAPGEVLAGIKADMEKNPPRECDRSTRRVKHLLAKLPKDRLVKLSQGELPFPPDAVESDEEKAVLLRGKHLLLNWLIEKELKEPMNPSENQIEEKEKQKEKEIEDSQKEVK